MARRTLKSMGIKRTSMVKHSVRIVVYEFKGKFYRTKRLAFKAHEEDRLSKVHAHRMAHDMPGE